jgi:hypothetical protein
LTCLTTVSLATALQLLHRGLRGNGADKARAKQYPRCFREIRDAFILFVFCLTDSQCSACQDN